MKKFFLVFFIFAAYANAAKFETCFDEVSKACGPFVAIVAGFQTAGQECSIVQGGERESDRTHYAKKVVFKDNDTLISITTEAGNSRGACDSNKVNLKGKFIESKQLEGRLFAVTNTGEVIVIARNNGILYLTNSKGKAYTNVTDIKIDQANDSLELTFDGKQKNSLSLKQVLEKLNDPSLRLCISCN